MTGMRPLRAARLDSKCVGCDFSKERIILVDVKPSTMGICNES